MADRVGDVRLTRDRGPFPGDLAVAVSRPCQRRDPHDRDRERLDEVRNVGLRHWPEEDPDRIDVEHLDNAGQHRVEEG